MKQGILSILVANHFGVLTKVTGLFSRRGYNIKVLSVGETHVSSISRITILAEGNTSQLEQICHQVRKLEDVRAAKILPADQLVERELALIKVRPTPAQLGDVMQLVTDFAAKTVSVPGGCAMIEVSGSSAAIDQLIEKAAQFHIVEMSRTGITALERSDAALEEETRYTNLN